MARRAHVTRFVVAVVIGVTGAVVLAASPHYKRGGQPVCTFSGATATCSTGQVSGLGNFDVVVSISFTASQGQLCTNKGGTTAAGQNPATGTGGAGISLPAGDIKNGNLTIPEISATAQITAGTAAQAGCPNPNWTVSLTGPVTISGGTYSFRIAAWNRDPQLSFTF